MTAERAIASRLAAVQADITTLAHDAIVNAANEPLIMGGGVDGAIRRKAGPDMERDLRQIGRCATGEAIITRGYRLPARFVIHTVAPVWSSGGMRTEEKERLLAACYASSLALADTNAIDTIAFPCIGTGIYGWPAERAADIAFSTVISHMKNTARPAKVTFCCFSPGDRERYATAIAALARS
jgi:O-acetyl-ADP-ribose deacetylase (regulator of RNase III)